MSKESFHSVVSTINAKAGTPLKLLDIMETILSEYKEEEIKVTPWTRCEVLVKILNVTNPELDDDQIQYITNSIFHDKGILQSIESLNEYANLSLHTSTTDGSVSVVVDQIIVTDSSNLYNRLLNLINELIFTLDLNLTITVIIHNIVTSVEVIDVATNLQQTRIIPIGRSTI